MFVPTNKIRVHRLDKAVEHLDQLLDDSDILPFIPILMHSQSVSVWQPYRELCELSAPEVYSEDRLAEIMELIDFFPAILSMLCGSDLGGTERTQVYGVSEKV
jgi:hypothetical protein